MTKALVPRDPFDRHGLKSTVRFLRGHVVLLCAALFGAGIAARVLLLAGMHFQPHIEFSEMEQIARSLAQTGAFADPYFLPTGPTAHHAPLYPFLLSLIFRWWGYGHTAALAMAGMGIAFAAAQYALLPALAVEAGLPVEVGALAGAIGAIPFRVLREVRWEASLNGLILVLCTFVAVRWLKTFRGTAATGLLFGGALIAMPTYLPVLLLLAGWAVWQGIGQRRMQAARAAAVLLACAAVGVSPWIARNYIQFRKFVFVRSNFPLELSLSNHDGVFPMATDNYSMGFQNQGNRHPYWDAHEARLVQQMGEIAYNAARLTETLAWCKRNKAEFLLLSVERFRLFWFPASEAQWLKGCLMDLVTAAGLAGVVLLWRAGSGLRAPLAAILLGFPLPYYLVQIDTRYRYPVDWCLYVGASYAVWATVQTWRRKSGDVGLENQFEQARRAWSGPDLHRRRDSPRA